MKPHPFSRSWRRLAAALLLAAAVTVPVCAARSPYVLTVRDGFVCILETATDRTVVRTSIPLSSLSQRDQLLLQAGLPLWDRTDYTTAAEDFCS